MKLILVIKIFFLFSPFAQRSQAIPLDAPVEEFFIEPGKIHIQALENVNGIINITFSELDYVGTKILPAKIQGYTSTHGQMVPSTVLALENIKPLSGVNYNGLITRRFPVVEQNGHFCS